MGNKSILTGLTVLCMGFFLVSFATKEGFYCDVFQDEGSQISGGDLEVDCEYIKFSQEHLTIKDKAGECAILVKGTDDSNGYLLYPDGGPRYQLIYFHGGFMGHADDLGAEGKLRIRQFYFNGGSPFGSCAGSYMLAKSNWFNIWQGKMDGPNVSSTPTDKIIPNGSPLIGYNNLKAGEVIKSVFHNNGGSVDTSKALKGTKFGGMHNSGKLAGYADNWIWKDHDSTGTVSGLTGHPEGSKKEDQIRYISAIMLYLADHLGVQRTKATLKNNEQITMDKKWEDNRPLNAMIGDKQYHHFILGFSRDVTNVKINVAGKDGFDFHVFVAKDTFAFRQKALYADTAAGANKTLSVPNLGSGKWYVGVKLNTTVTATAATGFPKYSGKLEVLNGISYTIKATWDGTAILADDISISHQSSIAKRSGAIIIRKGNAAVRSIKIFDLKGRLCFAPKIDGSISQYAWQPISAGAYVVRITSENEVLTKSITVTH